MNTKSISLVMAIALLLTAGCTQAVQEQQQQGGQENATEMATVSFKYTDADGITIVEKSFEVEKGTNAWDAMKANVSYNYDEYDFGVMVTSIAGVGPPQGHYLALYVDGEYATKGISDYTIEEDISIEWKTEKIEAFGLE